MIHCVVVQRMVSEAAQSVKRMQKQRRITDAAKCLVKKAISMGDETVSWRFAITSRLSWVEEKLFGTGN